jgi:hypothetical protein
MYIYHEIYKVLKQDGYTMKVTVQTIYPNPTKNSLTTIAFQFFH